MPKLTLIWWYKVWFNENHQVVEVASNDGTCYSSFKKKRNFRVEPLPASVEKKVFSVLSSFWGSTANDLLQDSKQTFWWAIMFFSSCAWREWFRCWDEDSPEAEWHFLQWSFPTCCSLFSKISLTRFIMSIFLFFISYSHEDFCCSWVNTIWCRGNDSRRLNLWNMIML